MSDYSSVAPPQSNINQSQAYAAALQRAKKIAAKIQPNTQPGGGGGVDGAPGGGANSAGYKRHSDDLDGGPDAKKFSSNSDTYSQHSNSSGQGIPGGAGGPPNMSQAMAQAAAVAARLAASAGTTCEEQIKLPESVSSQIVGRNSNETISRIQAESGCKVQLSQNSDNQITLRGSRETVTKGREVIQEMANRSGGGNVEVVLTINMPPPGPTGYPPYQEIMIPGTKVGLIIGKGGDTIKNLQEKTGAKMVIIQDGPNQELIKPLRISGDPQKIEHAKQLVLDLIAEKDLQQQRQNNSMGGGGGGAGLGYNSGGGETAEVFVPKIAVGVVIGKGGDMIRKIQTECGCRLQFLQGKNDEPGDRRCVIQGSHQQVEDAKRTIEGLIENMMQRNRSNPNGGGDGGANSNYGYGYGVNHTQQPSREEIQFMVPAAKCGIVIGRGGETIKLINQQTGAYCEMDRNAGSASAEKLFKCKGTPEQVEAARQMIAEKINMDLPIISRKPIGNAPNHVQQQQQQQQQAAGYGGMQGDPAAAYQQWGGYGQQAAWGADAAQQAQHQMAGAQMGQAAAAAGQADYSAQWIEYYKSMGMHREAEMIEQQLKAKQALGALQNTQYPNAMQFNTQNFIPAGGAAMPVGMPQPQAQQQPVPQQQPQMPQQPQQAPQQQAQQPQAAAAPDYSAQWAEYYRSIGKIEEAEAIEKQMKQQQNGQASNVATSNSNPMPAAAAAGAAAAVMPQAQPGYPQGMNQSQYAQYSQYYAAAAAAGGVPGAYGQQPQAAYGGYGAPGGYPGAPQPGMPGGSQNGNKPNGGKNDKN